MSLFAVVVLLAAAPAAGETAEPIVVTGTPVTREEARKRAAQFVRRAGVAQLQPVARWTMPVCPRTVGVDDNIAGIVDSRIRAVAASAGAKVAPAGCMANIVVVFTADGSGLARAILEKSPDQLAEMSPVARERILDGEGPIRWWYSTRVETRHGMPVSNGVTRQYNSSIVSTQIVRALQSATIIVDVEKADGTPLDAVASHAAMVALAEFSSNPPPPEGSIMGLFDGESGRRELSDSDAALLRGIYSIPPDRESFQHRRQLVSTVRKEQQGEE